MAEKGVTTKENVKESVAEYTKKLESGIKELFTSEKYIDYLKTMSKFHNYSINNTVLIYMQKPEASQVAGYNAWSSNFNRHVSKGEKGIKIFAPATYKSKQEMQKLDPNTNKAIVDEQNKPVVEEVEVQVPYFRVVSVFDVSQTYGDPLPELASELKGDFEAFNKVFESLRTISPYPIEFQNIQNGAKGYCDHTTQQIVIKTEMSDIQTLKTTIHEVAHATLHPIESTGLNRNEKEVEAESVAYIVCNHFGIDTSDYSFGYVAGWSKGKELSELKGSLDTIKKSSTELINKIEVSMQEKSKEINIEKEEKTVENKSKSNIKEDKKEKKSIIKKMNDNKKHVEHKVSKISKISNQERGA